MKTTTLCLLLMVSGCAKQQAPEAAGVAQDEALADDALARGNAFLRDGRPADAEAAFREGLATGRYSYMFRAQIALAQIEQGRPEEAAAALRVLVVEYPQEAAAHWYLGLALFRSQSHREAATQFLHVLTLLDPRAPQVVAAHWHIGRSYHYLISAGGISYEETDQLLVSFRAYVEAQPDAEDAQRIRDLIAYVEENRPPANVKRWSVIASPEDAVRQLEKILQDRAEAM